MVSRISIGDPQKIGDGLNAHTSYKVNTEFAASVPGLDALNYSVIRRFSDFVHLRDSLRDLFPYVIVPALPEKQQLGRFNQEFIDVRQRALGRWLERIAAHPELSTADPFRKFVSLPAEAYAALRETSRTEALKGVATAGRKTLVRFIKTATNTVSDAIAQARGVGTASSATAASSRSAEDLSFAELEAYLLSQGPLMASLYNQAAALAVRYREQAQLLLDFGAALRALGQTEGGPLGDGLAAVGVASWAASTAAYELAVCETEACVERLADYVRMGRAVKECVETRTRASSDLAEALSQVEQLRAKVTALTGNPSPDAAKKRTMAEADLAAAKKQAEEHRAYYDKVAAATVAEAERYRSAMGLDFRSILLDFVSAHLRAETKLASAWDSVGVKVSAAMAGEGVAPAVTATPAAAGGAGDLSAF